MNTAHQRPAAALVAGVVAAHLLALNALSTQAGAGSGRGGHLAWPAGLPLFLVGPERAVSQAERVPSPSHAHQTATVPPDSPSTPQGPQPVRAKASPRTIDPLASGRPSSEATLARVRVAPSAHMHFTLSGQTHGKAWNGQADLQWQHDGDRYEARLEAKGSGLGQRIQRSSGSINSAGLVPERFSDRARSEEAVHFRQEAGRITFSANRPEVALLAGAQDRLSVLLQLGALIAARPQDYPAGSILSIQTATAREAEVWRFRIEDTEELPLPGGNQRSVHLVRAPTRDHEPRIDLWLAPAMDYAPVRMRLTQSSGDWVDYQWVRTDGR